MFRSARSTRGTASAPSSNCTRHVVWRTACVLVFTLGVFATPQARYCDDAGMPRVFSVTSVADSALRRALVNAIGRVRHSCGTSPLPAVGFLLKLLTYHECGPSDDDSEFMGELVQVCAGAHACMRACVSARCPVAAVRAPPQSVCLSASHANPPSGAYDSSLTFLEEEKRAFTGACGRGRCPSSHPDGPLWWSQCPTRNCS